MRRARAHSLAIRADGEARAWGYNNAGRLGDGTETDRHAPVAMKFVNGGVEYTAKVTALAGGAINTLAIVHTGGGWGWGANGSKQLGNPLITADESETAVDQKLSPKTIAAGAAHSLEISGGEGALGPTDIYNSGDGWAWGANDQEQVKPGDMSGQPLGMTVTLSGGTAIAGGGAHSLELSPDGNRLRLGCKRPRSGRTWRRLEAVIIHITGQGSGGRWTALRGQGGCCGRVS